MKRLLMFLWQPESESEPICLLVNRQEEPEGETSSTSTIPDEDLILWIGNLLFEGTPIKNIDFLLAANNEVYRSTKTPKERRGFLHEMGQIISPHLPELKSEEVSAEAHNAYCEFLKRINDYFLPDRRLL